MRATPRLLLDSCIVAAATLFAAVPCSLGQPDLIVTAIGRDPAVVVDGQTVRFSATIANVGTLPTPEGVVHGVSFWVEGVPVSWADHYISSLAPGESAIVTSNNGPAGTALWLASAGDYAVMAFVDDVNRLPDETDETNNQFTTTVTVQASASSSYDLVVTDIAWTTASGRQTLGAGDWVWFSALVQNQGTAPTPDGVVHGISFWVDGTPICWNDSWTASLGPGESVWLTGATGVSHPQSNFWNATAGEHQVLAYIDDINRLPDEAHEDNNLAIETWNVATDTVVAVEVVAPEAEIAAGDAIYFQALVELHNRYIGGHFGGVTVSFFIDGTYLCTTSRAYPLGSVTDLVVDSRFRYYLYPDSPDLLNPDGIWIATPGDHRIEARIHNQDAPSSAYFDFTVAEAAAAAGAADLVVEAVFADPADFGAQAEVTFLATIRNAGSAPTPAGVVHGVSFWIDGQAVSWSDTWVDALAPGQSITVAANGGPLGKSTWTAEPGEHALEACVDDVNRMPDELDEGNNSTFAVIAVI